MTKNLLRNESPADFAQWMKWDESVKQTESGEIPFHYTQLSELKKGIPPEPLSQLDLSGHAKMLSVSREYDATIKELFFTAGHFEYRHRWQEGVKRVNEVTHTLPVVGSRYQHTLANSEVVLFTSSFLYDPDNKIVFSETDEKTKTSTLFVFEKINETRSRFTLELYLPKNFVAQTLFKIAMKRKMEIVFQKSLQNLEPLLKEIPVPEF